MCLCVCGGVGRYVWEGGVLVFFSLSRVFGTLGKGRVREHGKLLTWVSTVSRCFSSTVDFLFLFLRKRRVQS